MVIERDLELCFFGKQVFNGRQKYKNIVSYETSMNEPIAKKNEKTKRVPRGCIVLKILSLKFKRISGNKHSFILVILTSERLRTSSKYSNSSLLKSR
jgi:hypothetical protein